VHGERSAICEALLAALETVADSNKIDTVPAEVWQDIKVILSERGAGTREIEQVIGIHYRPSRAGRHAVGRQRLAHIASVLESAELELHATNDIFWDEVVAIEPIGEKEVFDATVLGLHNFVANGMSLHNSIEQDADVVILLHRDDYYDKESPRAGEADFIVAKHRNGPTDTITVAAQLHMSRFVDMAVS